MSINWSLLFNEWQVQQTVCIAKTTKATEEELEMSDSTVPRNGHENVHASMHYWPMQPTCSRNVSCRRAASVYKHTQLYIPVSTPMTLGLL